MHVSRLRHPPNAARVTELPDAQFVERLRDVTERYLQSVDSWEAQFQKFYRVAAPGPGCVSSDLEPAHKAYLAARKDLQECLPRARRLCLRHGLRDPWGAMMHINLGAQTPQEGATTAIGKSERTLIARCLVALESASHTPTKAYTPAQPEADPAPRRQGVFQRLYDYFF